MKTMNMKLAATAALALVATLTTTANAQQCNNCNNGSYVGDIPSGTVDGEYVGSAGCMPRSYPTTDLFYNYFTQGYCNQANAQMYLSPLPVPPHVGHTYYTYQPFYPHHMMYKHKDRFHSYYDCGRGMNRTRAVYSYPPIKQAASNFYWNMLRLPR